MASSQRRKTRISFFEILLLLISMIAVAAGIFLVSDREGGEARVAVMEQRLRGLRRLKTVSQDYRSVIYIEERNFWRGSKQVLFTIEYEVTAGVDFSRGIEVEELPDGIVRVRMPPAEIFTFDADESSIRQMFLREQSFFNPVSMGDYMPQVVAQGEANRDAALSRGILERAEANAMKAVERILGLGNVAVVVFEPLSILSSNPSDSTGSGTPGEDGAVDG